MCYMCCSMLAVIIPGELSVETERVERNKQKVTTARSLPLCCSLVSVEKSIILAHFRNVEEEFRSRNQTMTSFNTREHFAISHVLSRTDEPEVTVIYIGQNLKSNTFRHGRKNISLSIGLNNGWEEKWWEYIFFTAVWNGVQITFGHAIHRVSIIQLSLFYFSLRISESLNGGLYQNGTNLISFRS